MLPIKTTFESLADFCDYEHHTHFMLDLECLATSCPAVISEFSIVPFKMIERDDHVEVILFELPANCTYYCNMEEQVEKGAQIELSVLSWWFKQNTIVQRKLASIIDRAKDLSSLDSCLNMAKAGFAEALDCSERDLHMVGSGEYSVWAKPAAFDFMLMESLFRMTDMKEPFWHHRSKLCARTYIGTNTPPEELVEEWRQEFNIEEHTSYDDCILQIHYMAYAYAARISATRTYINAEP
ncbi:MAG: 3'-5' exoribonuclease [Okeania sp. SIO3H1]|nr:3'-5' exoribonuclease [Okeania sp. SIO3H1]